MFRGYVLLWAVMMAPTCFGLSRSEAKQLLTKVPRAVGVLPKCLVIWEDTSGDDLPLVLFTLRNSCAASGSGMIGPYFVNLETGAVHEGGPDTPPLNSPQLDKARDEILKRKSRPKSK